MESKRRIAFVAPGLSNPGRGIGGSEHQILNLALRLQQAHGWRTAMVAWAPWASEMGVEGVPGRLHLFGGSNRWKWVTWPVCSLKAIWAANGDVYYQRGLGPVTFSTAVVAHLRRRVFVWHAAHDSDCNPTEWRRFRMGQPRRGLIGKIRWIFETAHERLLRWALRRADLVVFQTETQSRRLAAGWGIALRRSIVVPNGHPIPALTSNDESEKTVLWLGAIKGFKRPAVYVELARQLGSHGVACRLAGRAFGSEWSEWVERTAREPDNNITYLGELARNEVVREIRRSMALVSTSLVEGFPNTLIEAWMCERPVLSIGFDPDGVIASQDLGLATDDVCEAVDWVARLADAAEIREYYAERCRDYATRHHDINSVAASLSDAIVGALAGGASDKDPAG